MARGARSVPGAYIAPTLIIIGASAIELRKKAIELGMITLRGSGLCKLREGITTIEEVVKETVL